MTLYLGAVAVALPVSGSLGDRFGHRTTFLAGVLAFGLASLLAALSASFTVLEGARILQAVSGALVSTSSMAIIREISPPGRRGEAFGLFDLLTSVSATVGPFIGGVLVGAFGWRSMFSLAVPIAVLAAASVWLLLDPHRLRDARGERRGRSTSAVWSSSARAIAAFLVALRGRGDAAGPGCARRHGRAARPCSDRSLRTQTVPGRPRRSGTGLPAPPGSMVTRRIRSRRPSHAFDLLGRGQPWRWTSAATLVRRGATGSALVEASVAGRTPA